MSKSEVKMFKYYYTRYGETVSFEARHDQSAMKKMVDDFGSQLFGIDHVWTDDLNGLEGDIRSIWIVS